MKKTLILITLLAAVAGAAVLIRSLGARRRDARPDIVLVSLDTLRADRVGCYGCEKGLTPFLDSLAREGTVLRDTIVQANWTLPSHVSLFTSLYPAVHGVQEGTQRMGPPLRPLAGILKDAGYDTAAFVDGGVLSRSFGFDAGFDLYDDRSKGEKKDERALAWMTRRRPRPFFLFYHTYDIHYPYRHHPRPRDFRNDPRLAELVRAVNAHDLSLTDAQYELGLIAWHTDPSFYRMVDPGKLGPLKQELDRFVRERWLRMPSYGESVRYIADAYDGGVRFADGRLGRLREALRAAGGGDTTLLVVTSDHGECLLEHAGLGHPPVLYDEILRVPLILSWPGRVPEGRVVGGQAMSIDILPTILDLAGVAAPSGIQGSSLRPLIEGRTPSESPPAYADSRLLHAVRTGEWKYIREAGGEGGSSPGKLYRLREDPGEQRDLAEGDPAERARRAGMLDAWSEGNARFRQAEGLEAPPGEAILDPKTVGELRALGYMQ